MPFAADERRSERVRAAIAVAALHALLGYALVSGFGVEVAKKAAGELKLISIAEPPPPPEEKRPEPARSEAAEGEASPVSMAAKPTPVVAPPPKVRIPKPPPLPTVPKATPVPPGNATSAGVAATPGPGSGTGGQGAGTGSGGRGNGTGGAARAQRISGQLANSDYPRSALRAGAEGTVSVRYTVGVDGRVSGCRVTRSSGHGDLDSTTCRLIERRFVYRPARDSSGRPVAETVRKTYDWLLPFKRGLPAQAKD